VVHTAAGDVAARRLDDRRVALEVSAGVAGAVAPPEKLAVEAAGAGVTAGVTGYFVTVGVPHFVIPVEGDLGDVAVAELGRAIRFDPVFGPAGTNVDFVRYLAPDRLALRTYERGVEGETLSCGTGVLAAAAVGVALGLVRLPAAVATRSGFVLEVAAGEEPGRWTLSGDARVVARGELLAGAAG
jgi:diaminopimelate epimerase